MARATRGPRWLRPLVDGAMTLVLLIQMAPGKLGNAAHEALGIAFMVLFVLRHVLNRGWPRRLRRQRTTRSRCLLLSDALLAVCVVGVAVSGLVMSRTVASQSAVPAAAHAARPLHGTLAYIGLMTCAVHVGLRLRAVRGYAGGRGRARVPWPLLLVAVAAGLAALTRPQVAAGLLGQPGFPDAMTPLGVRLALHVVLCLPFLVAGAMVDTMPQGGGDGEWRDAHDAWGFCRGRRDGSGWLLAG